MLTLIEPASGAEVWRKAATAIEPLPRLQLYEIAESHRWMPSDTAVPGRYSSMLTPWVREVLERLHPDDQCQVAVCEWAAQTAKSAIGETWIMGVAGGYYPGRMLVALDTLDNARDWSKDSLDAMIELSPLLRDRIRDSSSRAKNETMLGKFFPGGRLRIVGMHSASAVCRMAAKYVWLDEVDRAKDNPGYEGNVVQLTIARQTTFGASRKLLLTSTPTIDGSSEVHAWFEKGDQAYFNVPCPICGEYQPLEWEAPDNRELRRFIWDSGDPSSARYRCAHCGKEWQEIEKVRIMPHGRWIATRPDLCRDGLIRSYNLNALYSPSGMLSWPQLVKEWEDANAAYKANGDPKDLTAYVNVRKAKVFAPPGQSLDRHVLADRVEPDLYPDDTIPAEVRCVVGGTDVHHENLMAITLGIGAGWEIWVLDATRIDRSPDDDTTWQEHDLTVYRRWQRADGGVSQFRRWCVDSGDGQKMTKILEYCAPRFARGVYAIKGTRDRAKDGAIWETTVHTAGKNKNGGRFFFVHTTEAKNDLYDYLMRAEPGPRHVHIPQSIIDKYPDFLEQLTSEQRVKEPGSGRWVWDNPKQRANHWWDAFVYALAAAHSIARNHPEMFATQTVAPQPQQPKPVPTTAPVGRYTHPSRDSLRRGSMRSADWLARQRGGRR